MACPEWPQDKECSGRSFASFNPGLIHKSANGEYLESIAYGTNENRLEAYAIAPLRYTSPQVKVLHCLTVKGQEARRKGVAARRGLRHRSAR